ncbi:MAG TPA: hypothetical protein VF867_04385 [Arthrobacter sp.]
MTTTAINRQPEGIRAGGQFAATLKSDDVQALAPRQSLAQVLHLTSLPVGDSRTITPAVHGFEGIDTITVKNIGLPPQASAVVFVEPASGSSVPASPGTRAELTVTLPVSANVAELHDDEWSRRGAREATQYAVERHLGLTGPYVVSVPGLPADSASLDNDGNLSFTFHESFSTTDGAIDPEDLKSWMEPYQELSDPEVRSRLQEAITERYNER